MEVVKKIQQFISYWYVRYLVATELYMVDTWEKVIVRILFKINQNKTLFIDKITRRGLCIDDLLMSSNIVFGAFFTLFWYFNYSIIVGGIAQLRSSTAHDVEQIL
ncbi:hypothetical protein HF086_000069 [Spodoptera exigua]|uniref:Uncharacterized protein n=1 Tax=Spodoptera exigua TaxID=7107 RepID=A0A922SMX4_SPOEX|nr:hypothetical protein HF086_000069 [Spodoptera exigua]